MQTELKTPVQAAPAGARRGMPIPHLRWLICALLFVATTINYVDRTALSALKPKLEALMHWDEADYGWIMFFFQAAYAIFPSFAGRMIDGLGIKAGLAIGLILWSAMAAAHAFVGGLVGFCVVRFFLGAAEATNFPASIKAVAQWFPQKERAMATGIFNSGTNVGVMIMPSLVWIANQNEQTGWKWAFVTIGVLGLFFLIFWFWLYNNPQNHPNLTASEWEYIRAGQGEPSKPQQVENEAPVHWTTLLRYKQVWAFLGGKFLTDPVWWFYLYWLVPYLAKERGLTNLSSAGMLMFPYTAATIGAIGGGWISGHLIGRGWKVGSARFAAMGLCAVCMPGSIIAAKTGSLPLALFFISMATAAHQGWSSNIFTTATDMFPTRVAGAVVGLGTTAGGIGGMLITLMVGMVLQWTQAKYGKPVYTPIFVWAGVMHPLSWFFLRAVAGKDLKKADVDGNLDTSMAHKGLILGGAIAVALGGFIASKVLLDWAEMVKALKSVSAAAGGATAGVMIACIGLVVIYAGLPKSREQQ